MPRGSWLTYFRPEFGADLPAGLRLFAGAVSGAALSLSYIGFHFSIYSWVCLGVLLLSAFGARPRVAFGSGFLHALLFVFTSVPWIATVLTVHGGLSVAGGWGVLLLIAMAWGILIGTFSWAIQRISRQSIGLACIAAPFIWITFEFVRAHLPEISFPWNLLGYPAAENLALVQLTTITGIYGLSFLVAGFNALLAWAISSTSTALRKRLAVTISAATILLLVTLTTPRLVPQDQPQHFARAVQLNFPEVESYPPNWFQLHVADLDEITRISLAPSAEKPDLLVWPEAPAPFSFQDSQFAKIASALAIQFDHPFLVGAIEWKPPVDPSEIVPPGTLLPYNSALLFDSQGQRIFVYDKVHLVPFGEYEPFPLIHHVVASVTSDVGGFHKGNKYVVGQLPGGKNFGVFICYEAIYAGEVRRFAAAGAQLLINISNDGWFGRSAAAEQHLRMVRVRAAENRRWIVRTTNNGFTVSIDPYGRIYQPLLPDVRAAVDLPYDFRSDQTVYTRFGDWFAWLCVLVSVILVALTFRKAK
ncbi:MAG TPA: apolipoprotein N-acyltransferase [Candidatus Acidoferrum sp.]|nr:apolipoprotein N-acyltransferase [Candidatus Acidoferrum sp.]